MENEKKTYEYKGDYGTYQLRPWMDTYKNNNQIAIGFDCYGKELGGWEPYGMATINVGTVPYLYGCIDTNDNGPKLLDFLEENGFGKRTGYFMSSGYCQYPIFLFNEDKLKQLNPVAFADYQKAHGKNKPSLDNRIHEAQDKTAAGAAKTKDKELDR